MALECAFDFSIANKFAFFVIHLGWQVLFLALWVQILWWRLAVKTSDFPPTSNWQQGRLFCVSQKWRTLAGKGVLIGWWIGKDGKPWSWNEKFVEWESIDRWATGAVLVAASTAEMGSSHKSHYWQPAPCWNIYLGGPKKGIFYLCHRL